jgi:hypothetical protein
MVSGEKGGGMSTLIEARTGSEQHSSSWGKFYIHGLPLVADDYSRTRHESYRDSALEAEDGIVFSIWATEGDKYGTSSSDYYICVTDSAAESRSITGGCYSRGGYCRGCFRVLAHGKGKTKAPRLLEWVKNVGGIECMSVELAEHFADYIDKRGVARPPEYSECVR